MIFVPLVVISWGYSGGSFFTRGVTFSYEIITPGVEIAYDIITGG